MRVADVVGDIVFAGGVTGALGFKHLGFFFTLPLAAVLLALAVVPVIDDLRRPILASREAKLPT